ncbi:MAG: hypothetical protein ACRELB_24540 [Polyangiaceae bacterium]
MPFDKSQPVQVQAFQTSDGGYITLMVSWWVGQQAQWIGFWGCSPRLSVRYHH